MSRELLGFSTIRFSKFVVSQIRKQGSDYELGPNIENKVLSRALVIFESGAKPGSRISTRETSLAGKREPSTKSLQVSKVSGQPL
jgi:hypothetical protein